MQTPIGSLGAQMLTYASPWFCWKTAGGQQQTEKDESVMFAAEIPGLPWSLCCVDLLDFANPPSPLMFPKSIPEEDLRWKIDCDKQAQCCWASRDRRRPR